MTLKPHLSNLIMIIPGDLPVLCTLQYFNFEIFLLSTKNFALLMLTDFPLWVFGTFLHTLYFFRVCFQYEPTFRVRVVLERN